MLINKKLSPVNPKHQTLNNRHTGRKNLMIIPPKSSRLTYILITIILLISSISGFFYIKYLTLLKDPLAQVEQKNLQHTRDVINSLSKLILLPDNQTPTVAIAKNIESLKKSNPVFFKEIKKEDYLIIYPEQAIIYRRQENKIINIAPIAPTIKTDN